MIGRLPSDLDPSGEQARRWIAEELAKDDYSDGRSLFQRVVAWLQEQLDRIFSGGQAGVGETYAVPPVLTALLVAVLLGVLALLLTRVRADRHTAGSAAVLGDLDLPAPTFRDRGAAALREGRWGDAVLDYARALTRESADRTLLTEAPSLTAHEVGTQLAPVFPAHAPTITRAMDLFDAVRYGRYAATETDARLVADLDATLVQTRPVLQDSGSQPVLPGGLA